MNRSPGGRFPRIGRNIKKLGGHENYRITI